MRHFGIGIHMEKEEDKEVKQTIESVFSFIENKAEVEIPRTYLMFDRKYEIGNVKEYVEKAYDWERKQVNLKKLWEPLRRRFQSLRARGIVPLDRLIVLEKDMYFPGTNFLFGQSEDIIEHDVYDPKKRGGVIVSLYRIRRWYGRDWKLAFKGILLHEIGHFYGLPPYSLRPIGEARFYFYVPSHPRFPRNPNFIGGPGPDPRMKSGLDWGHCAVRECIMEQVNTPGRLDLLEKVKLLERKNPNYFCEIDLVTLIRNLRYLYIYRQ